MRKSQAKIEYGRRNSRDPQASQCHGTPTIKTGLLSSRDRRLRTSLVTSPCLRAWKGAADGAGQVPGRGGRKRGGRAVGNQFTSASASRSEGATCALDLGDRKQLPWTTGAYIAALPQDLQKNAGAGMKGVGQRHERSKMCRRMRVYSFESGREQRCRGLSHILRHGRESET
eukprot:684857-Pleurochrysis_carterae.AAC.1